MKKNKHLNHISPKMDKDESTKELNHIALVLATQKEDMLLMHETLLLPNPDF
jgi:alkylhydroperoxidase/carboxymuconolactone decarboxylase family protein YurZ